MVFVILKGEIGFVIIIYVFQVSITVIHSLARTVEDVLMASTLTLADADLDSLARTVREVMVSNI